MKVRCRKGDTLWYFSQLFDIPLSLIEDANPKLDHEELNEGTDVSIPGYLLDKSERFEEETLSDTAIKRQLSLDMLYILNQEGQLIDRSVYTPKKVRNSVVHYNREYDYDTFMKDLYQLEAIYPFIQINQIGQSVEGRTIPEILIGRGKKKVHFNGAFHANEWITSATVMRFVNDYLLGLTNKKRLRGLILEPFYKDVTLSIVPMVNPDGVELSIHGPYPNCFYFDEVYRINNGSADFSQWKANIRGVDLNDQFPADWDIEAQRKPKSPSPRDFPGFAPLSEPEAEAMATLTIQSQFDRVIAFHTQGQEIYWGYEGFEPMCSETIVKEFAKVSGYKAVQYLDSYAGYKDWFIQEFQRPGFTVELGLGHNPLPISQIDDIYRNSLGIFLASLYT